MKKNQRLVKELERSKKEVKVYKNRVRQMTCDEKLHDAMLAYDIIEDEKSKLILEAEEILRKGA